MNTQSQTQLVRGWPSNVISILESKIATYTNNNYFSNFYIGVTNDIDQAYQYTGFDALVPLYLSTSLKNASVIADQFQKQYSNHPKYINLAKPSLINPKENVYFVFIAVNEFLL